MLEKNSGWFGIADMETVWDSTSKAIFQDYSKYEAGFLQ